MREKNLIILCLIFAVLVGLVFFKNSMAPPVVTQEESVDLIALSLSLDTLREISIRLGDGTSPQEDKPSQARLSKTDGRWQVASRYGVYASEQGISALVEKFNDLHGELRSNKPELLNDYGITDDQGVHIELQGEDGDPLQIVVGTEQAGFQNNFVRKGGSSEVYIVNENLLSLLGVRGEKDDRYLDIDKWCDKRITHLDVNDVTGVQITDTEKEAAKVIIDISRELVEDKKQWKSTLPYDFGLSASKIKSMVEVFNNTYAREIVALEDETVFNDPGWKAVFRLSDGNVVTLMRGAKDAGGNNYYMKREGDSYGYLVPTATFNSRRDQQGNILASNPLGVEQDKIDEIYIQIPDLKKEFRAVKKPNPPAGDEPPLDVTAGAHDEKGSSWQTMDGKLVEEAKINDIFNKLKAINLEVVLQPEVSVDHSMVIRLSQNGVISEYTITKDLILNTGKECRFLKVQNKEPGYCASKSLLAELQNILP